MDDFSVIGHPKAWRRVDRMNDEHGDSFLQTVLGMGDRGEFHAVELWLERFIEVEGQRHPRRVMELLLSGAVSRQREDRWETLDRERLFIGKLLDAYRKRHLKVRRDEGICLDAMCAAAKEYAGARSGGSFELSEALDELYTGRKIEEDGIGRCAELLVELYTGKPSPPPTERMDEDGLLLEDALLYQVREEHPTPCHILDYEEDEALRAGAALALAEIEGDAFLPRLSHLMGREQGCVAWACVEAMGKIGTKEAIVQVRRAALEHPEVTARMKAVEALAGSRDDADVPVLTRALRDSVPVVRFMAGKTLLMRTVMYGCGAEHLAGHIC